MKQNQVLTIRVSKQLISRLRAEAERLNISVSALVKGILSEQVK